MMRYVAFLRGINVGGNKKVPMAKLAEVLKKEGFANVQTLLASGNILLETDVRSTETIRKKIEAVIEKTFGFTSHTIVRKFAELEKLSKSNPFTKIKLTKDTRFYITFLSEKPKSTLKIPWASANKDYTILKVTDGEICSVLDLSKGMGTIDSMAILEKEFGKNITTRNWNTVQKLLVK